MLFSVVVLAHPHVVVVFRHPGYTPFPLSHNSSASPVTVIPINDPLRFTLQGVQQKLYKVCAPIILTVQSFL